MRACAGADVFRSVQCGNPTSDRAWRVRHRADNTGFTAPSPAKHGYAAAGSDRQHESARLCDGRKSARFGTQLLRLEGNDTPGDPQIRRFFNFPVENYAIPENEVFE